MRKLRGVYKDQRDHPCLAQVKTEQESMISMRNPYLLSGVKQIAGETIWLATLKLLIRCTCISTLHIIMSVVNRAQKPLN